MHIAGITDEFGILSVILLYFHVKGVKIVTFKLSFQIKIMV